MRTFFGITPEQGAASEFPQYAARRGLSDRHLHAIAPTALVQTLTSARPAGSASDSPVVERRMQVNTTLLLSHHFH